MKNGIDLGDQKMPCLLKKMVNAIPLKVMSSRLPTFISYPKDLMETINLSVQIGEEINNKNKLGPKLQEDAKTWNLDTFIESTKRIWKKTHQFFSAASQTPYSFKRLEDKFQKTLVVPSLIQKGRKSSFPFSSQGERTLRMSMLTYNPWISTKFSSEEINQKNRHRFSRIELCSWKICCRCKECWISNPKNQ